VEVRFSSPATDVVRFECALDGAAYSTCASPVTYPLPRVGHHWFLVRAIDDVGNVDRSSARANLDIASPASCQNAAATVQAGTVAILKLTCVAYRSFRPPITIVGLPDLGRLGTVDQAAQTIAYTAPAFAGMTSFTYRSQSNVAKFNLTIRGPIGSGVRAGWDLEHGYTRARRLSVTDLPARATVAVRCLHKGCSYHRTWTATAAPHKALNLLGSLAQLRLRPGTVIQVRVEAPYATAKVVRYTVRAHLPPRRTPVQPPRSKK
jgi:hypothetical protein